MNTLNESVKWFNAEKTIVIQTYPVGWTWDNFDNMAYQTRTLIKEQSHTVHIIADYSQAGLSVPSGNAFLHAKKNLSQLPPNTGYLLIISQNRLISTLLNVFLKIAPEYSVKIRAFDTQENALQFLQELAVANPN